MLRDFLIYGLGGAASRLAAIFLVPLYTRTLDVTGYGQLELLLAIYTLGILLVGLQSESAILRDYYGAKEKDWLKQLCWAGVLITLAGLFGIVGLAGLAVWLDFLDAELIRYIPLICVLAVAAQIFGIQLIMIRFEGQPVRFAMLSFFDVVGAAGLSVLFMAVLDWGIWGALWGMTLAKLCATLLSWRFTFGRMPEIWPGRRLYARMLAYALPTMPSVLLNWLQTNGTRILLAIFLALYDVAIASIAIRVAALFGFVVYSFRLAWEPWAFRQLDVEDRDPDAFNKVLCGFVFAGLIALGMTVFVTPVLVAVFAPPAYVGAAALVPAFVLGQFWIGVMNITTIGIHGARVTSRLTWIFTIGASLNVVVLAVFAPIAGVASAAIAFVASTLASAFASTWFSETHFETNFSWRLLSTTVAASCGFAFAAYLAFDAEGAFQRWYGWQIAILLASLWALMLVIVVYIGMKKTEREFLANSAKTAFGIAKHTIRQRMS